MFWLCQTRPDMGPELLAASLVKLTCGPHVTSVACTLQERSGLHDFSCSGTHQYLISAPIVAKWVLTHRDAASAVTFALGLLCPASLWNCGNLGN
jgi:hypothetical protein